MVITKICTLGLQSIFIWSQRGNLKRKFFIEDLSAVPRSLRLSMLSCRFVAMIDTYKVMKKLFLESLVYTGRSRFKCKNSMVANQGKFEMAATLIEQLGNLVWLYSLEGHIYYLHNGIRHSINEGVTKKRYLSQKRSQASDLYLPEIFTHENVLQKIFWWKN